MKYVLLDLAPRITTLRKESSGLAADVNGVWSAWKNDFGVRGGLMDWGGALRDPMDFPAETQAEHFQGEIFRLQSRAIGIREQADELATKFVVVRERWSRLSALALVAPFDDPEIVESFQAPVRQLRSDLMAITTKLNALDGDLRDREEDFDDVFPRYQRFQAQHSTVPQTFALPNHWNNMIGDRPRRSLSYDFESRISEYLQRLR